MVKMSRLKQLWEHALNSDGESGEFSSSSLLAAKWPANSNLLPSATLAKWLIDRNFSSAFL